VTNIGRHLFDAGNSPGVRRGRDEPTGPFLNTVPNRVVSLDRTGGRAEQKGVLSHAGPVPLGREPA